MGIAEGRQGDDFQAIHTEDTKSLVLLFPGKDHCAQVGGGEAIHSFLVIFTFLDLDGGSRIEWGSNELNGFKQIINVCVSLFPYL